MNKVKFVALAILAASGAPAAARAQDAEAQAQAQALGQCFVDKTTGADRILVMRWMVGALASAPQMADLVKIDTARKTEIDKGMASLFTRLITVDCAAQAKPMFKTKSRGGFETAGGALGRIAMKELMSDPNASKALETFTNYLRDSDFAEVVK
jgi:hypothetical protein